MLYLDALLIKLCNSKFNVFDGKLVHLFVSLLLTLKSALPHLSDCHFCLIRPDERNADIIRERQSEMLGFVSICVISSATLIKTIQILTKSYNHSNQSSLLHVIM